MTKIVDMRTSKPGSVRVNKVQPKTGAKKDLTPRERGIHDTALSVTKPINGLAINFDDALAKSKILLADGLQQLTATIAMRDLKPVQIREMFDYAAGLNDAIDEAKKFARARVLDFIIQNGEPVKEGAGSKRIVYPDGRTQLAKLQKSGVDPKKFEAALRAKAVDVSKYMVPNVTYKLPEDFDGPKQAIDDRIFSEDEVTALNYEPSFALERSKEGKKE